MRVVMTGATSGIGLEAARLLVQIPGLALVIGARNPSSAREVFGQAVEILPLDLSDQRSVDIFAEAVAQGPVIDALVLNAGTQTTRFEKSAQGHEITYAANHLSHFLLLQRLLPHLAEGARVILTSSGTHDPAMRTGMPPPNHAEARLLADPARDPHRDRNPGKAGRRAYSSSKLANLLTARELARRTAGDPRGLMVAAYDPGFTPGTGLARSYPGWANWLFRNILPLVVRGEWVSTPKASGRWLAALVTDPAYASSRGDYWSVRHKRLKRVQPSTLARDEGVSRRHWDDSAALIGIESPI